MASRPWSDEDTYRLTELMERGLSMAEVAKRLDRSFDSIASRWNRLKTGRLSKSYLKESPPPLPPEPQPAPGEDLSQVAREFAKSAGVIVKPEVKCEWQDDTDIAELWKRAEENNAKHIAKARLRHNFSVEFPANQPIAISFASDQHIAPGTPVDMQRMRKDAELTRDTSNLYAILVGDGVDNHCLSEDTEVLTQGGWKNYRDLHPQDRVLGLNASSEQLEWQAIERLIVSYKKQRLLQIKTESVDLRCTEGHRILSKTGDSASSLSELSYERAADVSSRRWLPIAGSFSNPDWNGITDDELRVVALIATDGWINTKRGINRYFVAQRKSNSHAVREVLTRLNYSHKESISQPNAVEICGVAVKSSEPLHVFGIHQPHNRRIQELIPTKATLPSWVHRLSDRQFSVFLDAIIEGDGSWNGRAAIIYGKVRFLEEVQIACVTHGMSAKLVKVKGRDECRLLVNPKRFESINNGRRSVTEVEPGYVWCLNVRLENFMVRRNGKPHFTGNCKHRNAILAARSTPSDQYLLYEYYLSIQADSILAMASGNHDDWTTQIAGIDMVHRLAAAQKIAYAPDEVRISITVGGYEYKVAARHQYRFNSTMNQCHTVKQWFRFGQDEFDIGCVAHHHEPSVEMFTAHGQERWACRPGSYQISSSYSRQYGYNSTYPTCPTFILYPGERRIVGFNDLEAGVRFLKGETA